MLAIPAAAFGQQPRYVPFDFNSDLETILKQQLARSADLEVLLDFLKTVPKDVLEKAKIEVEKMRLKPDSSALSTTDPKLPEKVKQLMSELPAGSVTAKQLKAAEKAVDNLTGKKLSKSASAVDPQPKQLPATSTVGPPATSEMVAKDKELGRMTRDLMKNVENSPLGEVLRKSPAWQRGLEELQRGTTSTGKGMNLSFLEKWTGRLNWPDVGKLNISASLLNKIRSLNAPSLPRVNVNLPRLGGFNPVSAINLPGVPAPPALSWQALVAAGLVLVAGVLLWQLLSRVAKRSGHEGSAWRLGPWPIAPGLVSSPAEFIKAFEYLALLRFGLPARSWNHRQISEGLQADSKRDSAPAARRLMHLYEEARYAPSASWSPEMMTGARRDLCLVAGVSGA